MSLMLWSASYEAAIIADRIPNSNLEIIEKAGHNAFEERPKEVSYLIKKFVTKKQSEIGVISRP